MERIKRYRGALLGLAVGDALGTTLEFHPPGTFEPVHDMVGGGPFGLRPGEWTDDTSMALCLAESLIERRGFDPVDQLERYVRWYRQGYLSSTGECFDIGNTVREALLRFEKSPASYCGSRAPMSAGNGSIMRLAPVPLLYARRPAEAIRRAGDSSRTTHQAREAVDACRYLAALLVHAVDGVSKDVLLGDLTVLATDDLAPRIRAIARGSFTRRSPPDIRGTGYVAECLEAALWAFYVSESFADGALRAVNLGDDADTTGAVYGQLAGAVYGEEGIPPAWRERLAQGDLITRMADALFDLAETPSSPDQQALPRRA
jgi:ADP-ribosylglycohydrolase